MALTTNPIQLNASKRNPKLPMILKIMANWFSTNSERLNNDSPDEIEKRRAAAIAGDMQAMITLGNIYAAGRGIPQDDTEAVKWYRKAADGGEAPGMNNLGVMYESGRGMPKNEGEAARWYRKAAEQGNPDAKKALQRMAPP